MITPLYSTTLCIMMTKDRIKGDKNRDIDTNSKMHKSTHTNTKEGIRKINKLKINK